MPKKKKPEVSLEVLDFKSLLEEAVMCSRLGRTIASFGATLTGREKQDAVYATRKFLYNMRRQKRVPSMCQQKTTPNLEALVE